MPRNTHRPGDWGWPLGYPEIAIFLGVTPRAVLGWKDRGQLPPPDGRAGGSPYWWEDTIRDWAKKQRRRWPGDDVTAEWLYTEMERRAAERKIEEELSAREIIDEQLKVAEADLARLDAAARAAERRKVTGDDLRRAARGTTRKSGPVTDQPRNVPDVTQPPPP